MSTVHDIRRSAVLALPNGGEGRPSAADALCPIVIRAGTSTAGRACRLVTVDHVGSSTSHTLDAEARIGCTLTLFTE